MAALDDSTATHDFFPGIYNSFCVVKKLKKTNVLNVISTPQNSPQSSMFIPPARFPP
jgi:hypothetical protein